MSNRSLRNAARAAGLHLLPAEALTIQRQRCGRGFLYRDAQGQRIGDAETLRRIRSLAIPPAYQEVRIAADPRSHLQAVGRDAAGRVQYRYHPDWEEVREHRKEGRLAQLCQALPRLRRRIRRDLRRDDLSRERVIAGVVLILDRTHIRIGYEDYVHSGRSRGAATLLKRNVVAEDDRLRLTFRGKGGHEVRCEVRDASLARLHGELSRLPGRRLFQYRDDLGRLRPVTAVEVNAYLREVARAPVTAKDFRSLSASATACAALAREAPAAAERARRRQITAVMRSISEMLGNTPAVVRRSYVHRCVLTAFTENRLAALLESCQPKGGLSRSEMVIALLTGEEAAGKRPSRARR